MNAKSYRVPTELEKAFLRVVTRGYPELERQVEDCKIAEYDPTGWCEVSIQSGPPSPIRHMAEGPQFKTGDPDRALVGILLWTDVSGMLESVEVLEYGVVCPHLSPYRAFVDAEDSGILEYFENGSRGQ